MKLTKMSGHKLILLVSFCLLMISSGMAMALDIVNYLSPHNRERPKRTSSDYIVLHTTEGPNQGSLSKIHDNGEAHFLVDTAGRIYRTIEEKRLALHAGRSMWDGRQNIDTYSIGIEVVGSYNTDITPQQYRALKELLEALQARYNIPDNRVLTHSMVAYGSPNTWHKKNHRGRKRCGMLFARDSVRNKLGLDKKATSDPDVKAGRLVIGDPYLAQVLYGRSDEQEKAVVRYTSSDANVISKLRSAWDISGDRYKSSGVLYQFPDGRQRRGNEIKDWKKVPMGTKVTISGEQSDDESESILTIGTDGDDCKEVAGDEYNSKTTIYFLPDGHILQGNEVGEKALAALPDGTKVLIGYKLGGKVSAKKSAFEICGKAWNFPSTYYRMPDETLLPGNKLKEGQIPKNTIVFFRN